MAKDKKDMFASLKANVLNNSSETPQQVVIPVKGKLKSEETPFTLYIPTSTLKRLKILAATEGKSLKQLINEAIEEKYKT
ncbi:MAG: hypothetical protein EOO43_02925 [Flavobacterium sp.]|nr:MAG: hypothetical protein EOO43_02925 [Flavobacterium sp.]